MIGSWAAVVFLFGELFLSSVVHLAYGLYIFASAVAGDVSDSLNLTFRKFKLVHFDPKTAPPSSSRNSDQHLPPIVLVHGIFGFGKGRLGSLSYFAGAENKDERVLVPDLGSLTSIHDRARELFYYLKGGKVDYGEEHSRDFGHSQFGRLYEQGEYPEWDEDHPIHIVGHSAGAQVARLLQQMLANKAFKGHDNTSENWVLSITAISGAFNGTTRTYLDGMQVFSKGIQSLGTFHGPLVNYTDLREYEGVEFNFVPEDGETMKPISLLQLCRVGVIAYEWLDIGWLKKYYNFGFDHFHMSWKKMGILGLLKCLLGNTGPFASGDWILPDLTIQGSMRLNSRLQTFQSTYYFSYVTKPPRKIFGLNVPYSIIGIHPLLSIRALQMSRWRFPSELSPPFKGYRDEDWQENDGALNTISMTHPRFPIEHPSHFVHNESESQSWEPGIWHYKVVEADHISFVINRDRAGVQFDLIYDRIFERCRKHIFRRKQQLILPNRNTEVQS